MIRYYKNIKTAIPATNFLIWIQVEFNNPVNNDDSIYDQYVYCCDVNELNQFLKIIKDDLIFAVNRERKQRSCVYFGIIYSFLNRNLHSNFTKVFSPDCSDEQFLPFQVPLGYEELMGWIESVSKEFYNESKI